MKCQISLVNSRYRISMSTCEYLSDLPQSGGKWFRESSTSGRDKQKERYVLHGGLDMGGAEYLEPEHLAA